MPKTAYSPHTGELIETATPSDWMATTELAPPDFNKASQACFFSNGAWVIVDTEINRDLGSVPQQITRYQSRAALLMAGLLDDAQALIDSLPTDSADASANLTNRLTKMAWGEALHFERSSQMIISLGALLGLTPEQIDDLFVFGATIQ